MVAPGVAVTTAKVRGEGASVNLDRGDLDKATAIELLLHGLGIRERDVAHGIVLTVRADLDALATLGGEHEDPTIRRICESMDGMVNRLNVVLQLLADREMKRNG